MLRLKKLSLVLNSRKALVAGDEACEDDFRLAVVLDDFYLVGKE